MKKAENAISQAQIEEWKAAHGHVYKSEIDGEPVIWTRLKRGDYTEIMGAEEETEDGRAQLLYRRQEEVCRRAILYPADVNAFIESSAGAATVLAEKILDHSGFTISETSEL